MLKVFLVLCALSYSSATMGTVSSRFFNLAATEVEIDSVMPVFHYSVPLYDNYADSTYEVSIKYPEFIDMTEADIAAFERVNSHLESPVILQSLPTIEQQIVVDRKKASLEIGFVPIVYREGRPKILVSFMLEIKGVASAKSRLASRSANPASKKTPSAKADRYAAHSVLASGRWAKIRVPADGVYELTSDVVRKAGFSNLNKVKLYGYGGHLQNERLVGSELAALDDLQELATCTVGGKRLFYGKGPVSWSSNSITQRTRNPYSDYGYYFITEDGGEPLSVDSVEFVNSFYPSADDYHDLYEVDDYAWYKGGRNLVESAPINAGASKTYVLENAGKSEKGSVRVVVTAAAATTYCVVLNGDTISTMNISRITDTHEHAKVSSVLRSVDGLHGNDTIVIATLTGGPLRLDYLAATYATPRSEPRLSRQSFPAPQYVYNITNQDHHADTAVDMVIIIPTSQQLLKQAKRVADFHTQRDGMRVRIVPADELYNEFASGTPDANAYRRYLKMLYDRAESEEDMPRYLLLFGDAVWDNRMVTVDTKSLNPDNYLLAFESENSYHSVYCYVDDGWFTLLDDGEGTAVTTSDKQDVAVGRFPVTEDSEAAIMVDKMINYVNNKNAGDWQNTIMFMGDDGNQDLHMKDADEVANLVSSLYPGYLIKKVMWDAYPREQSSTGASYPAVTQLVKRQQAAGALVMNYAGHGSETQLSHERVLEIGDFAAFNNTNQPLWVTASCDIMPFDGVGSTIGETAVLNKRGGAVAFYGTTRTVYASDNKKINRAFMKYVLQYKDGKPMTLGEAQRLAKNELIETGQDRTQNKLQYTLLGDPAMSLNLPSLQIVVDSINGIPMSESPILKSGSVVSLAGHIVSGGELVDDFTGMMSATVLDTEERIKCRQNDASEAAETPFEYTDRPKILYNGTDSVQGGKFRISFAVPRDINYATGTGKVVIYAVNEARTISAHGVDERFYINGTEEVFNDSIGPSIFCYLNSPSFVNGGDVNCTPFFVAEITDKDGINASGNGIGHDMQLIIDGEAVRTYNLNDNFTFDFGSYTSGTTFYSIPALSPGRHTLKFRAWDILNNPSTATLDFNVVNGLAPKLLDVNVTRNPAVSSTTFIVTHSFIDSDVDVILDVFDLGGRILWRHQEKGTSIGNSFTVDWDLTVDSGARLQTGVYLYRIRLSSNGSARVSKAKKLIVLGNN